MWTNKRGERNRHNDGKVLKKTEENNKNKKCCGDKKKSHVITLYPSITLYLPVYSASQQDSSPLEAMHPARTRI